MAHPLAEARVLVTGSSGHLGAALVARLDGLGVAAVGMDPIPGAHTDVKATAADADAVRTTIEAHRITAIVHAGALHKPHITTHSRTDFLDANVRATHHLLEAATAAGVDRFVFTSTTSRRLRAGPGRARDGRGRRRPRGPRSGLPRRAPGPAGRLSHTAVIAWRTGCPSGSAPRSP